MNVLVVDDQRLSRKGIMKMIEWEQLDLKLAGECSNGKEALQIMENQDIDILLTDIRMPVMNGLELADKAKEWNPDLSVIVFSGYDDFEYIRRSLRLSVTDYLLKPVKKDELNTTLQNLVRSKYKDREAYETTLHKFRSQFFYAYLEGGYEDKENLELDYQSIHFGHVDDPICAVVMDGLQEKQDDIGLSEIFHFMEYANHALIKIRNIHALILSAPNLDEKAVLSGFQKYQNHLHCRSVVIGPVVNGIHNLQQSFETAYNSYIIHSNLSYHEVVAPRLYNEVRTTDPHEVTFDAKTEQEWMFHLKQGNWKLANQLLDQLFISNRKNHDELADSMLQYLLVNGSKELYQEGQINESKFLEACTISRNFPREKDRVAKEKQIMTFFQTCLSQASSEHSQHAYEQIEKAKRYVETHYLENINMTSLAQQTFMSPSYFSLLFRKVTGVNFLEYLTKLRMEFAKKTIKSQKEMKIYEIAEMCGYQDVKYFRKLFKKHTGMTPQKYKEKMHVKES